MSKNERAGNPTPLIVATIGAVGIMGCIVWFWGSKIDFRGSIRQKPEPVVIAPEPPPQPKAEQPLATSCEAAPAPQAPSETPPSPEVKPEDRSVLLRFQL